jgi:hypothetical protein
VSRTACFILSIFLLCFLMLAPARAEVEYRSNSGNYVFRISDQWEEIPSDIVTEFMGLADSSGSLVQEMPYQYGFQYIGSEYYFDLPYLLVSFEQLPVDQATPGYWQGDITSQIDKYFAGFDPRFDQSAIFRQDPTYDPEKQILTFGYALTDSTGQPNGTVYLAAVAFGLERLVYLDMYCSAQSFEFCRGQFESIVSTFAFDEEFNQLPDEGSYEEGLALVARSDQVTIGIFGGLILAVLFLIYGLRVHAGFSESVRTRVMPGSARSSDIPQDKNYGVKGFLAVLVFGLIIGSPLFTIVNLYLGYVESVAYWGIFPSFRTLLVIDLLLSVPIMLLGINAGLRLWKIQPHAVKITRYFLLTLLLYTFVTPFLFYILDFPAEVRSEILKSLVEEVRTVVHLVGWLIYLAVSKRVKATYAAREQEAQVTASVNA